MSSERKSELTTLSLIGVCLLSVQQAERVLAGAVEHVLDRPDLKLMEQTEIERKQTLGDFIRRLKKRVKIERTLKDKLYCFLNLKNTFVHNLSEVPGWDLKTERGRKVAWTFLMELIFISQATTALFGTLYNVSARMNMA